MGLLERLCLRTDRPWPEEVDVYPYFGRERNRGSKLGSKMLFCFDLALKGERYLIIDKNTGNTTKSI